MPEPIQYIPYRELYPEQFEQETQPQVQQPVQQPVQTYPELDMLEARNDRDQLPGWQEATQRDRDLWLQAYVQAKTRRQPRDLSDYVNNFIYNLKDANGNPMSRENIRNWVLDQAVKNMPLKIKQEYETKKYERETDIKSERLQQAQKKEALKWLNFEKENPELAGMMGTPETATGVPIDFGKLREERRTVEAEKQRHRRGRHRRKKRNRPC